MIKSIVNCIVSGRGGCILTHGIEIKYGLFFLLNPLSVANSLGSLWCIFYRKRLHEPNVSHSTYITLATIRL